MPLELLTLLGSGLLAGFMQITARSFESRRLQHSLTLQALSAKASLLRDARQYENRGFAFTRRIIALTATFFIIALPKLIPLFNPHIPVTVGYTELSGGFLFFTDPSEKVQWRELSGLVLTPLDTHLLAAVIGLYFGGSLTRT